MKKQTDLTAQQRLFADHYIETGEKQKSAIKAGFSEPTAHTRAYKLLRRPNVREYIEKRLSALSEKFDLTLESLLADAEEIKVRCMTGEPVFDANGQPTGEWKFEPQGALGAIDRQAKLLGMYKEKVDTEHKGEIRVIIEEYKE